MLGKLIKHEIRATCRMFFLIYAAVLFLAGVNRIFYAFNGALDDSVVYKLIVMMLTILYVIMIIGLYIAVMISVIQRFYKNLFGDEGYLMNTLPVKPWEHIVSKSLVSSLWFTLSNVVTILSVMIMISLPEVFEIYSVVITELKRILSHLDFSLVPFIIEAAVIMIIATLGYALPYYACIAVGQMWKKHRVLGGFLAYFALIVITQIVMSVIMGITGVIFMQSTDWGAQQMTFTYIHSTFATSIALTVLQSAACFLIAKYVLERKLDLE